MIEAWTSVEISKCSTKNSVIFKLYEQEVSHYIARYSLSLSLCGCWCLILSRI